MYATNDDFSMLSPGSKVRWNGTIREVEMVGEDYAVIEGERLSKHRINNMFKSHDDPFEVVL